MSASARQIRYDRCVVVEGDSSVGKRCMLTSYTTGLTTDCVPTVFDNVSTPLVVDGCAVNLGLWDTAGLQNYDRLRRLNYPQTDVFILCFSIISPVSFDNVTAKWIIDIRQYCPNTPIVLVGTKQDLRNDQNVIRSLKAEKRALITRSQGQTMAAKIEAYTYLECSARTQLGLSEVFEQTVRAVIRPKQRARCAIS